MFNMTSLQDNWAGIRQLDPTLSIMNTFYRPLLRSYIPKLTPALRRHQPILSRRQFGPSAPTLLRARHVASLVSGRPGSQTLEHAATNVKEELGNSASDLAKVIAGANVTQDAVVDSGDDSFVSTKLSLGIIMTGPFHLQLKITNKIAHEVPQEFMVLGLAG